LTWVSKKIETNKETGLWFSFRLMLCLWLLETVSHVNDRENKRISVTYAMYALSLTLSSAVFATSFLPCLEKNMPILLCGWNITAISYHLLYVGFARNLTSFGVWRHLAVIFLIPIWSCLQHFPLIFLWTEQIGTLCFLLFFQTQRPNKNSHFNWELLGIFVFLTLMGMSMVFTQSASADQSKIEPEHYARNGNQDDIDELMETVNQKDRQVQEEKDIALFLSHEIRNPLFNITNALDFFEQCLFSLKHLKSPCDQLRLVESMQTYTSDIRVGVEHCTNLLTNILSLQKN